MIHRHLEYCRDTPAEELPRAAIADILERGDLGDWKPLAVAIANDPTGPFADEVLHLIDTYPAYGTSALWRAWIDRRRARAEGTRSRGASIDLATLRRRRGLTQVVLARRLGISQSDLSKLERRRDVRLSTLCAYAKALGGRLQVVFEAGSERLEVSLPRTDGRHPPRTPAPGRPAGLRRKRRVRGGLA